MSWRTDRLTGTVVMALGAGVNTWLSWIAWQQAYVGWPGSPGLSLRRACSTTTCIGPVVGPTRTRTREITPLPIGGKTDSPVPTSLKSQLQVSKVPGG